MDDDDDDTPRPDQVFKFKVCLAGESGVGKSEFATVNDKNTPTPTTGAPNRECDNTSTIGIDLRRARREHAQVHRPSDGGQMISCVAEHEIWDTAGQERFNSIVRTYFRSAAIVVLFYSVIDAATFERLQTYWWPLAKSEAPDWCRFFIVGTKIDKLKDNGGEADRAVERSDVTAFAEANGLREFEADAVRFGGLSAYQVFTTISQLSCETAQQQKVQQSTRPVDVKSHNNNKQRKKKKC